jgi:hypothetical protein
MSDERTEGGGVTRMSFIKASAGAAAGAAVIGVPTAAALTDQPGKVVKQPSPRTPQEPVVAYVRDAERGEVTVVAGTAETTYRDPALVKRLLSAAPAEAIGNGDGANVIAP